MDQTMEVLERMVEFDAGCPERIQHFLKVYAFARAIAAGEGLDEHGRLVVETAALVHDIGIKPSLEQYGSCAGPLQEREGPPLARDLLAAAGYPPDDLERICFLVGHHHTYDAVDGLDYRILVEADFLVNAHEHGLTADACRRAREEIFRTPTGIRLLTTGYGL